MKLSEAEPILALIRRVEANSDYDIVYGGIPKAQRPAALTKMTIAQVLAWQDKVVAAGAKSSAAGAYQIIRKTLRSVTASAGVPHSERFDVATQDALAMHLLKGRGFEKFLTGDKDIMAMMVDLAKEWASFPVPYDMKGASRALKAGQSYYAGDGLNKALVSITEVRNALDKCRSNHKISAAFTSGDAARGGIVWFLVSIIKGIFGK